MESPISVLLRNGTHAGASIRLALKAEQVSIAVSRSPTQLAVPEAEATDDTLFDLGVNKISITISGIIDNVPTDKSQTTSGVFYNMEKISIGSSAQDYYVPYKNYLENQLATAVTKSTETLQLEIGDATTPESSSTTASTGGGIYEVACQRYQFTLSPGREDRWVYNLQFVSKLRTGITF